jgi:hypothetical protein
VNAQPLRSQTPALTKRDWLANREEGLRSTPNSSTGHCPYKHLFCQGSPRKS